LDSLLNTVNQEDHIQVDESKNYLEELVGEGKKFKSPEDMARGKHEADMLIETMKRRMDDLRTDYTKLREEHAARAKLEELVEQLRQQKLPDNTHREEEVVREKPIFDPTQLDSLVSSKIEEREKLRKQEENFRLVKSKLQEQYGSNYQAVLEKQILDLDLDASTVDTMARQHPKLLIKTLGLDKPAQQEDNFQTPPRSFNRTDPFKPSTPAEKTWSYYQKMRKENPAQYRDPKTQVQMHNDYQRLGQKFEDGDFHNY
jgi:hypothetical protein